MAKLDRDVERLELSVSSLYKLLGGNARQRQRFWEILKGITTPAEYQLAKSGLVAAERELTTVTEQPCRDEEGGSRDADQVSQRRGRQAIPDGAGHAPASS